MKNEYYRINEFCRRNNISAPTYYREVSLGRLRPIKHKGKVYISEAEIDRWKRVRRLRKLTEKVFNKKLKPRNHKCRRRRTFSVGAYIKLFIRKLK